MWKNNLKWFALIWSLLILGPVTSCKQDDPEPEPEPKVTADFSYAFNAPDPRIVTFTSKAENYKTLEWDFGDTTGTSNEINPVHVYNFQGTYPVTLTATSPSGDKATHQEAVTIEIPNTEIGKAALWLTKGDKSKLLNREADITITETGTGYPLINIDTSLQYQTMDGFGAALTGSSAWLIDEILDDSERFDLLTSLFSKEEGIGISYLRLTIGASDFSLSDYTYDDMPSGETDFELQHFTLEKDQEDVIPVLKEIIAIAPEIKLMGSPWSPPAWMKTNNSLKGGQLKTDCYSVYADYFVKYIQEMAAEGITIASITPQNEPLHYTAAYPCMQMQAMEQYNFINDALGPRFQEAGINAKIIIYDHNWDNTNYAISILNSPGAKDYISGSAFHAYAGNVSAMSTVHNAHPDMELHFTEISGGAWATNFGDNLMWYMQNIFIGTAQNWSRTALMWNLALDQNHGPQNNGCDNCRGVVTISNPGGAITKNEEFYAIGHFSKFVMPGAKRIASTLSEGLLNLEAVAFQNPDGLKTLIVCNYGNESRAFGVRQGINYFTYTIDAKSVASFVW